MENNLNNKPKRKPRISEIISLVVCLICMFCCIGIVIEIINANNNNRPPKIFNLSISYVPTESMEPTIMSGNYILFESTEFKKVDVDDIIVYYSKNNDMFIVHRVVEKEDNYLVTKGDNNSYEDSEKVTPDMVRGEYIMTLGFMSIFTGGISRNLIFVVIIIIFALMIILQVVSFILKSKTDEINEQKNSDLELMKEQLRKEILEEELVKLKEKQQNKDDNGSAL